MTAKWKKSTLSLLLIIVITFTFSMPVLAANGQVGRIFSGGEVGYLYPSMSSYIGFNKTFHFTTNKLESNTTGRIRVYIFKPNDGYLLKYFELTAGQSMSESFFLPPSGTYTVWIHNETNANVNMKAQWV